jgi:hypothetical protein
MQGEWGSCTYPLSGSYIGASKLARKFPEPEEFIFVQEQRERAIPMCRDSPSGHP